MENLIFTALLYLVIFGVLCNFVKTKPGKHQVNPNPQTKLISPQIEAKPQTTSHLVDNTLPDELPPQSQLLTLKI